MYVHEFEEPIDVETPLGRGQALFILCTAHDNQWTVLLQDSKAFVTFTQDRIRGTNSYTARRGIDNDRMREIITPVARKKRQR